MDAPNVAQAIVPDAADPNQYPSRVRCKRYELRESVHVNLLHCEAMTMISSSCRSLAVLTILAGSFAALARAADPPKTATKTPTKPAAKAVVQPEEVVHPPLRSVSPKSDATPRIAIHNDAATGRMSIVVDGAEAFVYRYGKEVGFPRFYPIWSPSARP